MFVKKTQPNYVNQMSVSRLIFRFWRCILKGLELLQRFPLIRLTLPTGSTILGGGQLPIGARRLTPVWSYGPDIRTRTLNMHVRRLRIKPGHYEDRGIETIFGVGDRFQPRHEARWSVSFRQAWGGGFRLTESEQAYRDTTMASSQTGFWPTGPRAVAA